MCQQDGKRGHKLDSLVDGLLVLLDGINAAVRLNTFSQAVVEALFKKTQDGWKGMGLDMAEFCLMLAVQVRPSLQCDATFEEITRNYGYMKQV